MVRGLLARASLARRLHTAPPYVQGQTAGRVRQYFYYIDHNGFLFLDDTKIKNFTCNFKDKQFLRFFFRRLQLNDPSSQYASAFPFVSPCGSEMNFVRAYDTPIVFQQIQPSPNADANGGSGHQLLYVEGLFAVPFQPAQLSVDGDGNFHHPAPPPFTRGLLSTKLALELGTHIEHTDHHAALRWGGQQYAIRQE